MCGTTINIESYKTTKTPFTLKETHLSVENVGTGPGSRNVREGWACVPSRTDSGTWRPRWGGVVGRALFGKKVKGEIERPLQRVIVKRVEIPLRRTRRSTTHGATPVPVTTWLDCALWVVRDCFMSRPLTPRVPPLPRLSPRHSRGLCK